MKKANDCKLAGLVLACKMEMHQRVYHGKGICPTLRTFVTGGGNELKTLVYYEEQNDMPKREG